LSQKSLNDEERNEEATASSCLNVATGLPPAGSRAEPLVRESGAKPPEAVYESFLFHIFF